MIIPVIIIEDSGLYNPTYTLCYAPTQKYNRGHCYIEKQHKWDQDNYMMYIIPSFLSHRSNYFYYDFTM